MKAKILIALLVSMILYSSSNAQSFTHIVPNRSLKAHIDVQNYSSYPEWERRQPRVRKKAARSSKKQKKAINRRKKRSERLAQFENRKRNI